MERQLPRIWVFIIAFALGINVSAGWRIYTLPDYSPPAPTQSAVETPDYSNRAVMEAPPADEPQLIAETHSCGASKGPQVYNYTDGGRITVNCRTFGSYAAAARELEKRSSGATIEESFEIYGSGNSGGKEVLITFPKIVRLRRNGSVLCEVEASSLKHLRLFEKRR